MKFYRKFYEWRAYVDQLRRSPGDYIAFAWYTRQRISPILQAVRGDTPDKPKADNFILDVGCAEGAFSFYLDSLGNVVGIDIALSRIKEAISRSKKEDKKKIDFTVGDAENLPFRSKLFDIVVCTELLEHVPHPNKLLDEMLRVTKSHGKVLMEVPNDGITFSKILASPLLFTRKVIRLLRLKTANDDIMGGDLKFLSEKIRYELKREAPKGFKEHLHSFTSASLELLLNRNVRCMRFLKTAPVSVASYRLCVRFPKIIPLVDCLNNKILKYVPRSDRHGDFILVCISKGEV